MPSTPTLLPEARRLNIPVKYLRTLAERTPYISIVVFRRFKCSETNQTNLDIESVGHNCAGFSTVLISQCDGSSVNSCFTLQGRGFRAARTTNRWKSLSTFCIVIAIPIRWTTLLCEK